MVFGLKISLPTKKSAEPPQEVVAQQQATKANAAPASKQQALTVNEFVARSKRNKEKGLEPTKPELIAYARYLGMDAITDGDLLWIAQDCLSAPLPAEWTEHNDNAGRVFYYNVHSHSSSWTHPLEQQHRAAYKHIITFRNGDRPKDDLIAEVEQYRRKFDEAEAAARQELLQWTQHSDDLDKYFYFNSQTQQSVWTDPRPAHFHGLCLQMKVLRAMSKHCGLPVPTQTPAQMLSDILSQPLVGMQGRPYQAAASRNEENEAYADGEQKRKKKKKDKDKDKEKLAKDDESCAATPGRELAPLGNLETPRQQRPPPVQNDSGWGASQKSSPGMLPPLGRNTNRLSTPPGDGLSSVGRAKVRAGIKLEPIKPGA